MTEHYGIAPERIWVTVEPNDDVSCNYWRDGIGLDPSRIQDDPGNVWGPRAIPVRSALNTELYVDLEWDQHGGGSPARDP
ncbi:MAG: hypothetical protein R2849_03100 [Thermomicrobiales bacterium]